MRIESLRKIKIGGIDHWILIRGNDSTKPLFLFIQAGPGFPIIHEANWFRDNLHFEESFVCVYWDQRGCGKSFSKEINASSFTLQQAVVDTDEVVNYLKREFKANKIFVVGFSLGATIAALTAYHSPQNFEHLFLVGIDVSMKEAEEYAYNFAMKNARKQNNRKAIKELDRIVLRLILTWKHFNYELNG